METTTFCLATIPFRSTVPRRTINRFDTAFRAIYQSGISIPNSKTFITRTKARRPQFPFHSGRFCTVFVNHEGANINCCQQGPKTEEERFKKFLQSKEKVVKLKFYLQDALGGANATVWEVARSPITATSSVSFGQVRVVDDLITATPDRNSEKLGRAQGVITFTGLEESALTMNLNFYFTSGEYSKSSLCIVGRNPISSTNRELPVVGGTGHFRMARGYSISNTYSYDPVKNYGVLEYTCYVAYLVED